MLTQLYLEYHQWASYRKLVLQDILNSKDCFQPVPLPRERQKSRGKAPPEKCLDNHGGSNVEDVERRFQKCLSYKVCTNVHHKKLLTAQAGFKLLDTKKNQRQSYAYVFNITTKIVSVHKTISCQATFFTCSPIMFH